MSLNNLLDKMWHNYCDLNPDAAKIYDLFVNEGETVINDHIALRTFKHPKLGIESLAKHFKKYGYVEKEEYTFVDKKLYAKHYEYPENQSAPKVFISELELDKMSLFVQENLSFLINQIPKDTTLNESFLYSGRHWLIDYNLYKQLGKESEYAAWVAAHGFRPNHFTISVNNLKKFPSIEIVNDFVKSKGYELNTSGGEVKGTPEEYLEQSSTMAFKAPVRFNDGLFEIPSCFYEFAKRYYLPNGELYSGFIAKSADKIFESTNQYKVY